MQALCQLTDQLTLTTTGQDPEPPASGCAAPMAAGRAWPSTACRGP